MRIISFVEVASVFLALNTWLVGVLQVIAASDTTPTEPAAKPVGTNATVHVFVATFENLTGNVLYDPVSDGFAELLAVRLAECPGVIVLDRRDLAAVNKEVAQRLATARNEAELTKVARMLHASHVISGRIYKSESNLRVVVHTLEIASARNSAAAEITTTTENMITGAGELAAQLATQFGRPSVAKSSNLTDSTPASGLCAAQGLSSFYAGDMEQAIMYFMRAVDIDPDYSDAIYWSALSYQRLGLDDHAALDCVEYIKKMPNGRYADEARKLLSTSKQRIKSGAGRTLLFEITEAAP